LQKPAIDAGFFSTNLTKPDKFRGICFAVGWGAFPHLYKSLHFHDGLQALSGPTYQKLNIFSQLSKRAGDKPRPHRFVLSLSKDAASAIFRYRPDTS
jgi:hypothetical protein